MQKSPCIYNKNALSGNILAGLIVSFCLIWILWVGILSSQFQKLVPDANLYLDVGRHINRGDGFILSLNIRQGWVGNSRKALAYQQPLYSLALSLLKYDDKVVSRAVLLNVAFSLATIILLFLAWRNFLPSWQAGIAILPFAFSVNFYDVYSTPLSESLSMLILAATFAIFLSSDKYSGISGLLFGLSFLVRAPNALGILGLLVALAIKDRKNFLKFLIALALPIIVFEIVGFAATGEWYPSYAEEAKVFRMTRDFGGASYENATPSLTFTGAITLKTFWLMLYHNVSAHLKRMISEIGWLIFLLSIVGALGVKRSEKKEKIHAMFMFALANAVLFAFVFYFTSVIEARYSLLSLAIMLPLSIVGIQALAQQLSLGGKVEKTIIILLFIGLAIIEGVKTYNKFEAEKSQYMNAGIRDIYFNQPVEWIKNSTRADDLVATNYYQVPFIFNRPVVCLPINRQLTQDNLKKFLQIHKPKAILVDIGNDQQTEWQNPLYLRTLEEGGYKQVDSNGRFVFYVFETKDK